MNKTSYKLNTFLEYFKGRENYIAVQGSYYYPIKQKLNNNVVTKHLNGIQTYGIYVLTKSSKCNFICIDIDIEKNELSKLNFYDSNVKYLYLKEQLLKFQVIFENELFKKENILYETAEEEGIIYGFFLITQLMVVMLYI